MHRTLLTGLGAVVLLTTVACTAEAEPPTAATEIAVESATVESESMTMNPDFRTYQVSGTTPDEVPITATVELEPRLYTTAEITDPTYADIVATCGTDPDRDAVILGQVSMTFENAGFDEDGAVNVYFFPPSGERMWFDGSTNVDLTEAVMASDASEGAFAWGYGVGYSETDCYSNVISGPEAIQTPYPQFRVSASIPSDETEWGPVPIAFITPGYLSPKHPDGNPGYEEIFSHLTLCIGGQDSDAIGCSGDFRGPGSSERPTGPQRSESPRGGTWFSFL